MIERANLLHTFLTMMETFIQNMVELLAECDIEDGS